MGRLLEIEDVKANQESRKPIGMERDVTFRYELLKSYRFKFSTCRRVSSTVDPRTNINDAPLCGCFATGAASRVGAIFPRGAGSDGFDRCEPYSSNSVPKF